MSQEFEGLSKNEKLKAENEFLKMKMMLENGAMFGSGNQTEMPPEIENEFLQRVMAYEKQSANPVYIKLYDKIQRPTHFKPVAEINEAAIDDAWEELSDYLQTYSISLGVCSPNISVRELYRFTVEELFDYEMNDMHLPGTMTCFTYDEFYPDPYYDNTRAAVDDCINIIPQKRPMEWTPYFNKENLRLNNHTLLTEEELKIIVNRFKEAYSGIEIIEIKDTGCAVNESKSVVDGHYNLTAIIANESTNLSGNWQVFFEKDNDLGYWYINAVEIEGVNF